MIRLTETICDAGRRLCLGDPAGVRLLCGHGAYAGCAFALFWEQEAGGAVRAVLSSLDGRFTLAGGPDADYDEVAAFLTAAGADEGFCTADVGQALGWTARKRGAALRLDAAGTPEEPPPGILPVWNPSPGRVFEVLAACAGSAIELPERTAFYADLSHRTRHGAGRSLLLEREGFGIACAAAFEMDEAAYISGVAVLPPERGKGLGAAALEGLCDALVREGRVVWALAEKETTGFYVEKGFVFAGEAGWFRLDDRL